MICEMEAADREAELRFAFKRPELFDREGRERLTKIALGDIRTRQLALELVAHRIVTDVYRMGARTSWLAVMAKTGLPRPRDSEPRGKSGWAWQARFGRDQRDEAVSWTLDAIRSGHEIAYSNSKSGPMIGGAHCIDDYQVMPLYRALKKEGLIT